MNDKEAGIYSRTSDQLKERLYLLKGQWFVKGDACEVCGIVGNMPYKNGSRPQDFRDAVGQVLYNWSHNMVDPVLEQNGKRYWVIEREFKVVKPNMAQSKRFNLHWPRGVDDKTAFSFAETVVVTQGDVIGLGGEGNRGKSTFALNMAIENCEEHNVTLIMSENVHRLDERLSYVDWKNIFTEDGNWKFEVIEEKREERFLDIARSRKNNLVILDWLDASKDSYLIGQFYRAFSERLDKGIGMVIQQKRSYKDWAVGGEAARDYSSIFLLLQEGKLVVDKAKVYDYFDPNAKMYRFDIAKNGSRFANIAEVSDCPQCKGRKHYQGTKCGRCYGKGYISLAESDIEL